MIRQDELAPARARRRAYFGYPNYGDMAGKLHYPSGELIRDVHFSLDLAFLLRCVASRSLGQGSVWFEE
jgi:hypothetical protein